MIRASNLVKTYDAGGELFRAVDGVSLKAEKGEILSVVGHSGSGKTTLLSLLGGLTRPDSGSVVIDGTDIWTLDDDARSEFRNKKIGFIYQFASLIPTLNALENVMLPAAFGSHAGDLEDRALELLSLVGLKEKAPAFPSSLSGGQQRRVAIARAFINGPGLILADEPTGDLDEKTEEEVIDLFRRMNVEYGVTFVIVTHSREIAEKTGRKLAMNNGVLSEIK